MAFENWILRYLLWALFISLLIGGAPWKFPGNGKYWLLDLQTPQIRRPFAPKNRIIYPLKSHHNDVIQ